MKKIFLIISILIICLLPFIFYFSLKFLIKNKIDLYFNKYNISFENINIDPFGKIEIKKTNLNYPSSFGGSNAELIIVRFNLFDSKKIQELIVKNYYIKYKKKIETVQEDNILNREINFPEIKHISLINGVVNFNDKIFNISKCDVLKVNNIISGSIEIFDFFFDFQIQKNDSLESLIIKTNNEFQYRDFLSIDSIIFVGSYYNRKILGLLSFNLISDYLTNKRYNAEIDFVLDSLNPKIYFEEMNLNINVNKETFSFITDSLYFDIPRNDNFNILTYKLSGNIEINIQGDTFYWKINHCTINNFKVFSKYLSKDTVLFKELKFINGSGLFIIKEKYLIIDSLKYQLGENFINISGDISMKNPEFCNIDISSEKIEVKDIIKIIPPTLLPHLEGIEGDGSLSLEILFNYNSLYPESTDISFSGQFNNVKINTLGNQIYIARLRNPFSTTIKIGSNKGNKIFIGESNPNYISFNELDTNTWGAVLVCEDGGFFYHHGISQFHLRRALRENLVEGRYISGGSTITMQLARNLFLSDEKTISRKIEELILAWQLERGLTKKRILEIYLNLIEYGPEIRGINSGAKKYFGVEASGLDILQSAFLASIIPNPRRYYRIFYKQDYLSNYWRQSLNRIMRIELRKGYIDSIDYQYYSQDSIELKFYQEYSQDSIELEIF